MTYRAKSPGAAVRGASGRQPGALAWPERLARANWVVWAPILFSNPEPWKLIGSSALANVLQYFIPGAGDAARFHNLPGRPLLAPGAEGEGWHRIAVNRQ